ncbi:3746_t:CDS:2, partial [Racocetra fulgida]
MGLQTKAFASFLHSLCNKELQPQHFFTDKDFAQISATKEYIEKAIKEKIKSCKKIKQTQYQPNDAIEEFSFIDPDFKPDLTRTNPEYYIIYNPELANTNNLIEIDEVFDLEMRQICREKVTAIRYIADHLEQELLATNLNYISWV